MLFSDAGVRTVLVGSNGTELSRERLTGKFRIKGETGKADKQGSPIPGLYSADLGGQSPERSALCGPPSLAAIS
jgi:hypothetical protein